MNFTIDNKVFDLFPNLHIGIIYISRVNNKWKAPNNLLLNTCKDTTNTLSSDTGKLALIEPYKIAMKKIKKKKGAKASIDALYSRLLKGHSLKEINPIVDIYNAMSIKHVFPCGGSDLDSVLGDMVLTFATGEETFVGLGEMVEKPPRQGELIYKDNIGAIVRSWLWRESDRTKITDKSQNIILYLELLDLKRLNEFNDAIHDLSNIVKKELDGKCYTSIISSDKPSCKIDFN